MLGSQTLMVSGFGDDGIQGLFIFEGDGFRQLDALNTRALAFDNNRLYRVLPRPYDGRVAADIVEYGVGRPNIRSRIPLWDPHDIAIHNNRLVAVSCQTNAIIDVDAVGGEAERWRAPGEGDSWHLNSLGIFAGDLVVSAFGAFAKNREWLAHKDDGSGLLYNVDKRKRVLTGLCCPHNPTFLDGRIVICNSARKEVLAIDAESGALVASVQLGLWTRGLLATPSCLIVGGSAPRESFGGTRRGAVFLLDKRALTVVEEIPFPSQEIYGVIAVPRKFCARFA